jgi:hypothetical protein
MSEDTGHPRDETPPARPDVAQDGPKQVLAYESTSSSNLVILCRKPLMEAELAKAKLESEGIQCMLRDTRMAVTYSPLVSEVPLLVLKPDEARAREILARPADDRATEGEYVDENWRCPRCHHRAIDLVPLTRGWRLVRATWVTLLAVPVLIPVIQWAIADAEISQSISDMFESALCPWISVLVILGTVLFMLGRKKRCRDCGFEWSDRKSAPATKE